MKLKLLTIITLLSILLFMVSSLTYAQSIDPLTTQEIDQINDQNQSFDDAMMIGGAAQQARVAKWAITKKQYETLLDNQTLPWSIEPFTANLFLLTMHPLDIAISGSEISNNSSISQSPGAIHLAGGLISKTITQPPSSSVEYLADLGSKIGLVKPAYAQDDTGYKGLSGVLETWKIFRNISYSLFVVIFVVVGFMIMFRSKLNPQTAVNLQLALPKLVITLLLITFSYAISGFVIDMIYFTTYLAAGILQTDAKQFINTSFPDLINIFNPWGAADAISNSLAELFPQFSAGDIAQGILTAGNDLFGFSLLHLIVGGAVLYSLLKLLIQLVLAYVNIIFQVIFAPIILLLNALPAGNTFSSWIKNLIANAAAFPTVAIVIMTGKILMTPGSGNSSSSLKLPFIGFLSGNQNFIQTIIGFGLIMSLPKIVTMIQETLKAKPTPIGGAIMEGLGAPLAFGGGILKSRKEALLKTRQDEAQAKRIGKAVETGS